MLDLPSHWLAWVMVMKNLQTAVFLCLFSSLLLTAATLFAAGGEGDAELINQVKWTAQMESSGQPTRNQLAGLVKDNFGMVINLAPPPSEGSIQDEGGIVAGNGLVYVNIPVDWDKPTLEDFHFFTEALAAASGRRVLVHCQINMRASTFTFLYRVVHDGVDPHEAWEKVTEVWVPHDQWMDFVTLVLENAGIDVELM
jgi:protein tyrosine phosphatase (PTP) superfamily phosphohydrolase (DUF442 family)